jgi:alanine dehydrogenase
VVVIGGGVVGVAAATIAHGMRANVTVMDLDLRRLAQIDQIFAGNVKTLASSEYEIEKEVMNADLVIGAVLVHGAKAPKLVSNALVKKMKGGSVLVDVAIDQGGCFEDSKPTTHQVPTYKVHDAIFYCVANMPGAVPATSTYALANATIGYGLALANKGWQKALSDDAGLALGLNVNEGKIIYAAVAKAHNL